MALTVLVRPPDAAAGQVADSLEESWKVMAPPALIPSDTEYRVMLLHDVTRMLRELDRAAIVQRHQDTGCLQYFQDALELSNLVLTSCVTTTPGGAVITFSGRAATVEVQVEGDDVPASDALAYLEFKDKVLMGSLSVVVTRPEKRVVLTFDNANGSTTVQKPLATKVIRTVAFDADSRVWRFANAQGAGPSTVLQWRALKSGDEFSQDATLTADGKTRTLGKLQFYGAINRWVIEPLCTLGEEVRGAVADAIQWPEVLSAFARDCKSEGIRVGGKRAWFP